VTSFQRIARETLYEGKILRLYRDRVLIRSQAGAEDGRPREQEVTLEHVEHQGAACAVPFLDDARILMLRQFRYSAGGEIWEVPAGKLDGGEPPEECIRRELVEETGYSAGRLELLTTLIMTPGMSDERCAVFEATELTAGRANTAHDEFLEVVEMPLHEALRRVERGEIQDAKTVVGILLAARRRGL
jgi:ADP-ribose pyrophosphatase